MTLTDERIQLVVCWVTLRSSRAQWIRLLNTDSVMDSQAVVLVKDPLGVLACLPSTILRQPRRTPAGADVALAVTSNFQSDRATKSLRSIDLAKSITTLSLADAIVSTLANGRQSSRATLWSQVNVD